MSGRACHRSALPRRACWEASSRPLSCLQAGFLGLGFNPPSASLQAQIQQKEDLQISQQDKKRLELSGGSLTFDPGESWNFDFHLSVAESNLRAHVLRGGSYALTRSSDSNAKNLVLERLSSPSRQTSERLADLKGLTFSFSASGWLVIYQLGVAECLQNHGARFGSGTVFLVAAFLPSSCHPACMLPVDCS